MSNCECTCKHKEEIPSWKNNMVNQYLAYLEGKLGLVAWQATDGENEWELRFPTEYSEEEPEDEYSLYFDTHEQMFAALNTTVELLKQSDRQKRGL